MVLAVAAAFVGGLVMGSAATLFYLKRRMESQLQSLQRNFDELADMPQE